MTNAENEQTKNNCINLTCGYITKLNKSYLLWCYFLQLQVYEEADSVSSVFLLLCFLNFLNLLCALVVTYLTGDLASKCFCATEGKLPPLDKHH